MDPVFADSNTKLNGPAFDLTKCVGTYNNDGSITLTLSWTPIPNATSYKLIHGGKSAIVLNSIYLNTFIDQNGCFESKLSKTSALKEYLTNNTTYNVTYPASYFLTNLGKIKPSFLVYPYFGKTRGPAPYSVLLLEISGPVQRISVNTIYAKIKPNISVSLVEKNLILKHNLYEYFNHYTNKKRMLNVPLILNNTYSEEYDDNNDDNVFGNIGDDINTLESATLFYGALTPTVPVIVGNATSTSITVSFDVAEVGGSNRTFSCLYGTTGSVDTDITPINATHTTGTIYQCIANGLTTSTNYYFMSVSTDSTGSSKSALSGAISTTS